MKRDGGGLARLEGVGENRSQSEGPGEAKGWKGGGSGKQEAEMRCIDGRDRQGEHV